MLVWGLVLGLAGCAVDSELDRVAQLSSESLRALDADERRRLVEALRREPSGARREHQLGRLAWAAGEGARARAYLERSFRADDTDRCGVALDLAALEVAEGHRDAARVVATAGMRGAAPTCRASLARLVRATGAGHTPETEAEVAASPSDAAVRTVAAELVEVAAYVRSRSAPSIRVVASFDRLAEFTPIEGGFHVAGARLGDDVAATPLTSEWAARIEVEPSGDGIDVRLEGDDGAPLEHVRLFALPDPFRVVIDASREEEESAAEGDRPPVERVVLDPGHGGDDHGARAFGLKESTLALDIALRTRQVLRRLRPGISVVLTREDDTFVSLEQRSSIANAVGADLFVSIHLNGLTSEVEHGGVTTFVLDTTDDRQAIRLAARENGGEGGAVDALDVLMAGFARETQLTRSRAVAAEVHRAMLAAGREHHPRLFDRGVRDAMFYVLVGTTMPAILVETSFLTFEEDARALENEAHRQRLAEGIAEGIVRYDTD